VLLCLADLLCLRVLCACVAVSIIDAVLTTVFDHTKYVPDLLPSARPWSAVFVADSPYDLPLPGTYLRTGPSTVPYMYVLLFSTCMTCNWRTHESWQVLYRYRTLTVSNVPVLYVCMDATPG
jgi:hypothetical protein